MTSTRIPKPHELHHPISLRNDPLFFLSGAMAKGESAPADDLSGKLHKVAFRAGGRRRSPRGYRSRSSSPTSTRGSQDSDWAPTRGRQFGNWNSRSLEEGDDLAGAAETSRANERTPLSRDQRGATGHSMVGRKKDFKHMERVDGQWINVLEGLEIHTGVFSAAERKRIVDFVYDLREKGRNRQLRGKLHQVSVRGGRKGRSPASINGRYRTSSSPATSTRGSPDSDWTLTHGQHVQQFSNWSSRSLDEGDDLVGVAETSGANGGTSMSRDQREAIRFSIVGRKKDFKHMERVDGQWINVLEGLELHTRVFSAVEQKRIVDCIYDLREKGRNRELRERTYSEPPKWMRGKGRVTIQFGCCYNYAVDKHGNPPGIVRDEEVDPIPPLLNSMVKRMVAWHVLPPTCVPNSCIINMYDKDDCIPPHIDHHDFVRPFCTVSFLSECNILFGRELKVIGPGEFSGSTAIPLPVGSVLVLKGNGADVAKHCVPAVPSKRISITFRRMDDRKVPYNFSPDPALQNLHPLPYPPRISPVQPVAQHSPNQQQVTPQARVLGKQVHDHQSQNLKGQEQGEIAGQASSSHFKLGSDDFLPPGSISVEGQSVKPSQPLWQ